MGGGWLPDAGVIAALRGVRGVLDVVLGDGVLTVVVDAAAAGDETPALVERACGVVRGVGAAGAAGAQCVEIPVLYDGPDLGRVAGRAGLDVESVVRAHTSGLYRVGFFGFAPGFAYLRGLDERLCTPRLGSPRERVAAGSVGIGGVYTGVYPSATPGGWNIIGRTPVRVGDGGAGGSVFSAGGSVRFRAIDESEFEALAAAGERGGRSVFDAGPGGAVDGSEAGFEGGFEAGLEVGLEVGRAGQADVVLGLRRWGSALRGVGPGGAADEASVVLGNRLVGNADGAGVVEMQLVGGVYRALRDLTVAVTGAAPLLEVAGSDGGGRVVRPWGAFVLRAGEALRVGGVSAGARAYLCVGGGVALPGVGEGVWLETGAVLRCGSVGSTGACDDPSAERAVRLSLLRRTLRVTAGPRFDLFDGLARSLFEGGGFVVGSSWSRAGLRLGGPRLAGGADAAGGVMRSEAAFYGCVQVLPSGDAVVLGAGAALTGGYPVIATVVQADLDALGQLRPGDGVRFRLVSVDRARHLARARSALLDAAVGPVGGGDGGVWDG